MYKEFLLFLFICFCLISNSYTADYEKGLAAARSGNFLKAIKEWKPLAEEGDARVQYSLALVYTKLGTTEVDDNTNLTAKEQALNWYLLAAEQGVIMAQYDLAVMYHTGRGAVQDYSKAIKWYKEASIKGYSMARGNLGLMYIYGTGVKKNYKEGLKWLRFAAEGGNSIAQEKLGELYYEGQGVEKNKFLSHIWLNIAVHQGLKLEMRNEDKLMKNMSVTDIEKVEELTRQHFFRLKLFYLRQDFT